MSLVKRASKHVSARQEQQYLKRHRPFPPKLNRVFSHPFYLLRYVVIPSTHASSTSPKKTSKHFLSSFSAIRQTPYAVQ